MTDDGDGDGFGDYRQAIDGIELARLDYAELEDSLAACHDAGMTSAATRIAAAGANAPELQLFRLLDLVQATGEEEAAFKGAARILATAHATAAEAHRSARTLLARAMAETGAPSITSGRYTADPIEGGRRVEIDEPEELPSAFLRFPEPEPDRERIRAALMRGDRVPGARLVTGRPSVRISAKESRE